MDEENPKLHETKQSTPAIVNVRRSGMKGKIPFYSLVAKAWEQSGTKYKKKILLSYTGFKRHTS